MMSDLDQNLKGASKIKILEYLQYVKDLPLSFIASIAVIGWILLFTPLNVYIPMQEVKQWLPFITIIFTVLTLFLSVSRIINYYRSKKKSDNLKKRFI
jgi:hypothetical protein